MQFASTRNMGSCRSITRAWEAPPPVLRKANPITHPGAYHVPFQQQVIRPDIHYWQGFTGGARHTGHVLHRLRRYQKEFPHLARIRVVQQAVMCWWFWCGNMRKLGVIWAITYLNAGALSLRCEIYEVSNDNSDICGHPRPMMEGECSL